MRKFHTPSGPPLASPLTISLLIVTATTQAQDSAGLAIGQQQYGEWCEFQKECASGLKCSNNICLDPKGAAIQARAIANQEREIAAQARARAKLEAGAGDTFATESIAGGKDKEGNSLSAVQRITVAYNGKIDGKICRIEYTISPSDDVKFGAIENKQGAIEIYITPKTDVQGKLACSGPNGTSFIMNIVDLLRSKSDTRIASSYLIATGSGFAPSTLLQRLPLGNSQGQYHSTKKGSHQTSWTSVTAFRIRKDFRLELVR